jgi:hypothetical protein
MGQPIGIGGESQRKLVLNGSVVPGVNPDFTRTGNNATQTSAGAFIGDAYGTGGALGAPTIQFNGTMLFTATIFATDTASIGDTRPAIITLSLDFGTVGTITASGTTELVLTQYGYYSLGNGTYAFPITDGTGIWNGLTGALTVTNTGGIVVGGSSGAGYNVLSAYADVIYTATATATASAQDSKGGTVTSSASASASSTLNEEDAEELAITKAKQDALTAAQFAASLSYANG